MEYINPDHMKLVNKQAQRLFSEGKEPTIKDPFLTFLSNIYNKLEIIKLVKNK